MSYVVYDRTLQRTGFRPRTNPYGAAHGLSTGRGSRQASYPMFEPRGGSRLHGLGDAGVPDGSTVTYKGQWTTIGSVGNSGITPVLQAVEAALSQQGLIVSGEQVTSANFAAKSGLTSGTPFQITLQISVNTGLGGFGQAADLAAIVNGVVYQVTGIMGIGSVVSVSGAPTGAQPPIPPPGAGNPADPNCIPGMPYDANGNPCPGTSPGQSLTAWFEGSGIWIVGGIVVAVLVAKRFL